MKTNINLENIKNIHFIGIGGIGMRGIAELLHSWSYFISGSDMNSSDNTDYLVSIGIDVNIGHAASNIKNPDLVVYTAAVSNNNAELLSAQATKAPVIKRAEMLGLIMKLKKKSIGVCGTHGKTTTSSMVSKVIEYSKLDPISIIGGVDANFGSTTRMGKGDVVIVEADEFDRSFLKLFPTHIVVTTIDLDHQEHYHNLDNVKETFLEFIHHLPKTGVVAICNDDENIRSIIPAIERKIVTYGIETQSDIMATDIHSSEGLTKFTVVTASDKCEFSLTIPGDHNIKNALSAVAMGLEYGISLNKISEALADFKTVERRMQIISDTDDLVLVDDYAHHPAEVSSALKAVKARWNRRTIAIFQPHLFTRTQSFYKEFAESLSIADIVIVVDIYPAREKPIEGVSSKLIVDEFSDKNKIHYIEDKASIPAFIKTISNKGDLIITMGAGDINKLQDKLLTLA